MYIRKQVIPAEERYKINRMKVQAEEIGLTNSIVFVALAENGTIDEITATEHLNIFSPWGPGIDYAVGNLRTYNDKLYKCIQAHRSQIGWTPNSAASLWVKAGDPTEEWPEWSQPVGAADAYMNGDKVSYNQKHWISTVDNNVWAPGVYGWDEVN